MSNDLIYRDQGSMAPSVNSSTLQAGAQFAQSLAKVGMKVYETQQANDAIKFNSAVKEMADKARVNNLTNPAGFQAEFRAAVNEWRGSNTTKTAQKFWDQLQADTESRYMTKISLDSVMSMGEETIDSITASTTSSLARQQINSSLWASEDAAFREVAKQGITADFAENMRQFSLRDGWGRLLIQPAAVEMHVDSWNRNLAVDTVAQRLGQAKTKGEIADIEKALRRGEITALKYNYSYSKKDGYTPLGPVEVAIDYQSKDSPYHEAIGELIENAKIGLRKRETSHRDLSLLESKVKTLDRSSINFTQRSVDEYYAEHSEIFQGNTPEERMDKIRGFVETTGRLPTQVASAISGAVYSNDQTAVAVAVEFSKALSGSRIGLSALYDLFGDDQQSLARLFQLSKTTSTLGTTDAKVRERMMEKFSRTDQFLMSEESTTRDDAFENTLSWFEGNIRQTAPVLMGGQQFAGQRVELSDSDRYLLNVEYQKYLRMCGGDSDSASKMLKASMASYRYSAYGVYNVGQGGSGTDQHPMRYPVERYMRGYMDRTHYNLHYNAIFTKISNDRWDEAVTSGAVPSDAVFRGAYSAEWDGLTDVMHGQLEAAGREGLGFIHDDDGNEVNTPSYLMIGIYEYGGVEQEILFGEINPSLEMGKAGYDVIH